MSLTVVKYVPEGIVLNPNNNLECIMRKNYKSFRTLIVSTFKHLFCSKAMHLSLAKESTCHHPDTLEIIIHVRVYESASHFKSVLNWLDLKLKYVNDISISSSTKQKRSFKTSFMQYGLLTHRLNLRYGPVPEFTPHNQEDLSTSYNCNTEDIKAIKENKGKKKLDEGSTKQLTRPFNRKRNKSINSEHISKKQKVEESSMFPETDGIIIDDKDNTNYHDSFLTVDSSPNTSELKETTEQNIDDKDNTNDNDGSIPKMNCSSVISELTKTPEQNKAEKDNTDVNDSPVNKVNYLSMTSELKETTEQDVVDKDNIFVNDSSIPNVKSSSLTTEFKETTEQNVVDNDTTKDYDSTVSKILSSLMISKPLETSKQNIAEKTDTNNLLLEPSKTNNLNDHSTSLADEMQSTKEEYVDLATTVNISNNGSRKKSKSLYSRNEKGETKLHAACSKGKWNLLVSLLVDGFNPNIKDNAGWTPLHEAVKFGKLDAVKELISYGANINALGYEYETPLFIAIKYNKFDIANELVQRGADVNCVNLYDVNVQSLNAEMWSKLMKNKGLLLPISSFNIFQSDKIVMFVDNISFNNATINRFCMKFNVKLLKNILNGNPKKDLYEITHIVVSKTKNNTCNVNFECLFGIANGLFIVNENWISDSLNCNTLKPCIDYEVKGTTELVDCNGPKTARLNKENMFPKLFDGISVHIARNTNWKSLSYEHLKKLTLEFGGNLLVRSPNPEMCRSDLKPYHCRKSNKMSSVSNIILYNKESERLIKYNMNHLKVFHISWFMNALQKHSLM